jgi:predicted unusual protein kinase regulating ubiquinone biosynthesis (AarF/ABC1/UbiB family)
MCACAAVKFPTVSTELLAETVLIESWAPGATIDTMFKAGESSAVEGGVDVASATSKGLAAQIFDMTIKMFLRDNFVHRSGAVFCTAVSNREQYLSCLYIVAPTATV